MGPSRILAVVILIAVVTTVMLVIADTAFAQVQPTPTTMLNASKSLRRNLVLRFLGKSLRRASPCELLPTLPAHLALPRGPIPPPHPRQRGSAVSAASALGARRRRIDG